jgi:hypothetical protein
MSQPEINKQFELASHFVQFTNKSVFVTGKAGTGKTTFLRYLSEQTLKNSAIVAPTGVAAINAGGATIHSFFQLPLLPFLPTHSNSSQNSSLGFCDLNSLFSESHFNQEKIDVLRKLEILIVDEVSMVRADTMDAMDVILRKYRYRDEPFGGVQLVLIGDLYQLPPVVKNEQWPILNAYYKEPYFFESKAIKKLDPEIIELTKIYRQQDNDFIEVLNRIRTNTIEKKDLQYLNSFLNKSFRPTPEETYITLTTHNEKSEATNRTQLKKLSGEEKIYSALIEREFSDKNFPADQQLHIKVGAQVMFIRNDRSGDKLYYNGMLAIVISMEEDSISVLPSGETNEIKVERETWKNIRYSLSESTKRIEEEVLGTFKQFPLRLAWAITIHKSQGLTFNRAIIDAGESFAPGQVYVALSRLSNTKEMVLKSSITESGIRVAPCINDYLCKKREEDELEKMLHQESKQFLNTSIRKAFQLDELSRYLQNHRIGLAKRNPGTLKLASSPLENVKSTLIALSEVTIKLNALLKELDNNPGKDLWQTILQKSLKGIGYYHQQLRSCIVSMNELYKIVSAQKGSRQYSKELHNLIHAFNEKMVELNSASVFLDGILNNCSMKEIRSKEKEMETVFVEHLKNEKLLPRPSTGETKRISLELFKSGLDIGQISVDRGLTIGTVETHLISFIKTGEITLNELVTEEEVLIIEKAMNEIKNHPDKKIIDLVDNTITWAKIHAVKEHKNLSLHRL